METSKATGAGEEVAPPTRPEEQGRLALRQVMDHALLDRNGQRTGRVDDVRIRFVASSAPDQAPRLVLDAIVTGPLARRAPAPFRAVARLLYRWVGVRRPEPAAVPWSEVSAIDALVHLRVDREDAGFRLVDKAALRFISHIPGSARRQE